MTGFFAARIRAKVSSSAAFSVSGSETSGGPVEMPFSRNLAIDHVVWHFDVDRTFVTQTGFDATNNLGSSPLFIEQDCAGDGDLIVDPALGFKRFYLVMEERIFLSILASRRAADHHDRRFFGIGAGNGVQNIESADAVGHTDQTDSIDTRIGVSRKASRRFMRHGDALDLGLVEPCESGQSEVTGNAERMPHATAIEVFEQEFPQRHRCWEGMGGNASNFVHETARDCVVRHS